MALFRARFSESIQKSSRLPAPQLNFRAPLCQCKRVQNIFRAPFYHFFEFPFASAPSLIHPPAPLPSQCQPRAFRRPARSWWQHCSRRPGRFIRVATRRAVRVKVPDSRRLGLTDSDVQSRHGLELGRTVTAQARTYGPGPGSHTSNSVSGGRRSEFRAALRPAGAVSAAPPASERSR